MNALREALAEALRAWRKVYVDPSDPERWYGDSADAIIAALPPGSWLAGPEERAVIEAAVAWHRGWDLGEASALDAAVDALLEADR